MDGLRIAMVTETYPPEVNGVARTVSEMVEGLRLRGHSIQLVRPRQNGADRAFLDGNLEEVLGRGIAIPRYPQLKLGLPARRALWRQWSLRRPDVVHIATEGPLGWSALAAARALDLPAALDLARRVNAACPSDKTTILPAETTNPIAAKIPTSVPEGCIFSNELLDALPTHRVVMERGVLRESFVGINGDRFI